MIDRRHLFRPACPIERCRPLCRCPGIRPLDCWTPSPPPPDHRRQVSGVRDLSAGCRAAANDCRQYQPLPGRPFSSCSRPPTNRPPSTGHAPLLPGWPLPGWPLPRASSSLPPPLLLVANRQARDHLARYRSVPLPPSSSVACRSLQEGHVHGNNCCPVLPAGMRALTGPTPDNKASGGPILPCRRFRTVPWDYRRRLPSQHLLIRGLDHR